jgi:hypothetical protein
MAADAGQIYDYDAELGWLSVPNSSLSSKTAQRTIEVRHNSLGLRDIELATTDRPTIAFIGDSFVWGYDAQAEERFTDVLRARLPRHRVVNAGVTGYGTDQELLLLRRLWDTIRPSAVVLVFCSANDRFNNTTNSWRDGPYKPYFTRGPDSVWRAQGIPAPWSRQVYFGKNWFARNSWVVRVAVSAFVLIANPVLTLEDPTEALIDMMRAEVEARGAKFLLAVQGRDAKLEAHLQGRGIPFVTLEGAEHYRGDGDHWTPKGHLFVADRIMGLLSQVGAVERQPAAATR